MNCMKLYIVTEVFNRKSPTLVLLSLINNSLPEKIQNRSKMPQDAPLFKKRGGGGEGENTLYIRYSNQL